MSALLTLAFVMYITSKEYLVKVTQARVLERQIKGRLLRAINYTGPIRSGKMIYVNLPGVDPI